MAAAGEQPLTWLASFQLLLRAPTVPEPNHSERPVVQLESVLDVHLLWQLINPSERFGSAFDDESAARKRKLPFTTRVNSSMSSGDQSSHKTSGKVRSDRTALKTFERFCQ